VGGTVVVVVVVVVVLGRQSATGPTTQTPPLEVQESAPLTGVPDPVDWTALQYAVKVVVEVVLGLHQPQAELAVQSQMLAAVHVVLPPVVVPPVVVVGVVVVVVVVGAHCGAVVIPICHWPPAVPHWASPVVIVPDELVERKKQTVVEVVEF